MSIGPWQIVLILVIVLLIFGTKKLGNIGTDLSKAIRDFKKGMNDDDKKDRDATDAQARNTQADNTPGASGSDASGESAKPPEGDSGASSHKPSDRH